MGETAIACPHGPLHAVDVQNPLPLEAEVVSSIERGDVNAMHVVRALGRENYGSSCKSATAVHQCRTTAVGGAKNTCRGKHSGLVWDLSLDAEREHSNPSSHRLCKFQLGAQYANARCPRGQGPFGVDFHWIKTVRGHSL